MYLSALAALLVFFAPAAAADTPAPEDLKDLFFGEALYCAFQAEWFDAIARLDAELAQHHRLDEPRYDTLYPYIGQAEFAVGDFELAYRMHRRAGRAISAVIEGDVASEVRNEAIFRLARIYFQKDQPQDALYAIERIQGQVPEQIRHDLAFLRAQILMANGYYAEAVRVLTDLQDITGFTGFATYNLGIALLEAGRTGEGRRYLDRTGQLKSSDGLTLAIRDKSNLVLGTQLLEEKRYQDAKLLLDRVRLTGPFSNRALLGSGWSDAFEGRFERALVPWRILMQREVTDASVQEALLAVPYAYGKLNVYSQAALLYNNALAKFSNEIDKLDASIKSIREGFFLKALVREELKQDTNWVVKLRSLPSTPETYYLLDLMASHDFQESLKNYLDLEALRQKMATWESDLDAFEQIIAQRRAYYEPLLPGIDQEFRRLDTRMRLRLSQRDRIEHHLKAMLTMPRPDFLATSGERIFGEQIAHLKQRLAAAGDDLPGHIVARVRRLRGVLDWHILTEFDRRFTEAHAHLRDLNGDIAMLMTQYTAFVRMRQAATQSYQGYGEDIDRCRQRIREAESQLGELMARQGQLLEDMAVNELSFRRERLAEFQVKARFAMADSYDRATRKQIEERIEQ
ncbi:MAG: hypothetical protein HKP58_17410 [Desulfatitalea sp.]|nr:hypothetical protein [Desulfatitalea sp.]